MEGPDRGRVIQHASRLELIDCTFVVSAAGRQRVLVEKRKNVHAGVRGRLLDTSAGSKAEHCGRRITYDPYRFSTFVDAITFEEVLSAASVRFEENAVFVSDKR